jgi:uncharacterized lipoprotein NlpE involved in copper resistance
MKKIVFIFLVTLVLSGCKNNEETKADTTVEETVNTGVVDLSKRPKLFKGEFIYTADAAVLKGANYIYAVKLDSMTMELAKQVEPIKKDEFDMVPVVVQGSVSPNPALKEGKEGWEQIITIERIVSVSNTPSQADVKIEDKN